MNKSITIMGSGNTGLSTALKLKKDGHKVCLFELEEFSESSKHLSEELNLIFENQTDKLNLDLVTNNIDEALDFSKIIILCVPAYAHKGFGNALSHKITKDHIAVLMPGTLGSLELRNILEKNNSEIPIIGETDTSPYVCRRTSIKEATILGEVPSLGIGILPKVETEKIVNKLQSVESLSIDKIDIDGQLIDKIIKFAPIKHILKNKSGNKHEIIELLDDISRDLMNYDLEFRIQELESKFSEDLSETTFNELKELKKLQNIN